MRRWWFVPLALLLVFLVGVGIWMPGQQWLPQSAGTATPGPARIQMATRFLDLLDEGKYEDALVMATPELREGLAGGKLQQAWEGVSATFGNRRSRAPPRSEMIDGKLVASSHLQFATLALDARVVFDATQKISGFWIVPASAPPAAPADASITRHREREVTIGATGVPLPGLLTLPEGQGPFAAVILVHGSGPHDRDETIGPNKPFLDLADGLAARGLAVLRYEKRTMARADLFAHAGFTVDDETVDDALAAAAFLRTQADIDPRRIHVAGHSLGAMMAPRIGQRDPAIAGLILLAPPASKLEDIVVRQTRYLARLQGQSDAEIEQALAALEPQRQAVKHLTAGGVDPVSMLLGLPASYWRDLNAYDPIATARAILQPMLLLQGSRDYQVTPADEFSKWRSAFATDPRFELIEYPMLGHAFMPGSDPPGPKDYELPGHVDSKVLDDIAAWVKARPAHAD